MTAGDPPRTTMHEIGWINWFDRKKGCGYIEWPGHSDDIHVSVDQIRTDLAHIEKGVAVSFDLPPGSRTAVDVRLLREESCLETLERALRDGDDSFFQEAFIRLRDPTMRLRPKHARKIAEALEQRIDTANLCNFGGVGAAIHSLPSAILKTSELLRERLLPAEHLAFCLEHLAPPSRQTLPEVLALARKTSPAEQEFWRKLPPAYYTDAAIRERLPLQVRIPFLVDTIQKAINSAEAVAARKELQTCMAACEDQDPGVWKLIGTDLLFSDELWEIMPRAVRLNVVTSTTLEPHHLEQCPGIIEFISAELRAFSTQSQRTWERLPRLVKNRPEFARWRELEILLRVADDCLADDRYEQRTTWGGGEVYTNITNEDKRLAKEWMPSHPPAPSSDMARMLSARCAEKVALQFYASLGHEVADISKTQPNGDDWKDFDLLLNGSRTVDVKNARPPLNRAKRYTKHTVRRLKETRTGSVTIAGVLSPYLTLNQITTARNDGTLGQVMFLGETDRPTIARLEQRFSRVGHVLIRGEDRNVIPPWAFEYPAEFYHSRNASRRRLQEHDTSRTASFKELQNGGHNPLPAFLLAGLPLPSSWEADMSPWESTLYRLLLSEKETAVTMPTLFLTLLTHFLVMTSQVSEQPDFDPSRYRSFVYASGDVQRKRPLGVFDPLGIVDDLVTTLQTLWAGRQTIQFDDFESFDFRGLGLLRGTRRSTGKAVTILAYCGGYVQAMETCGYNVQPMGRCGYSPLIVGKDGTCPQPGCGRLVCEKCGYCRDKCPLSQHSSRTRSAGQPGSRTLHP